MPLIEELPLSTPSRAQPGWAYVPEVSSQVAAAAAAAAAGGQTTSRKRNRGANTLGSQSAKQQKAIEQRLKDLEKENYKDVQIAIPRKEAGVGVTTASSSAAAASAAKSQRDGKKTASNARRILGYNRTFAHYLADEEAAIQAGQQPYYYVPGMANLPVAAASNNHTKNRSSRASTVQRLQSPEKPPAGVKLEPQQDVDMTGLPASITQEESIAQGPAYPAEWDSDPLLRTLSLPARPSERVMQQLLAEPPLSWNDARAKKQQPQQQQHQQQPAVTDNNIEKALISATALPPPPVPPRYFCIMCGYWGKIKCRKCAERVCGVMECWRAHEAAGCGDRPY